ncbi:MAG TPA: hypothetical protein VH599_15855 [Ktedonobacterales bacterium]|jgi:hypothetical protein
MKKYSANFVINFMGNSADSGIIVPIDDNSIEMIICAGEGGGWLGRRCLGGCGCVGRFVEVALGLQGEWRGQGKVASDVSGCRVNGGVDALGFVAWGAACRA